jgi:hypothetical protein
MPEPQPNPLDEMFRAGAKRKYERDGEIEIDEVAVVSCGSDPGAYVQAWVWVSNEEAGIEPIRCAHCGTQGEHVEVQASVSGTPGLVCCEMENATPPYSCPGFELAQRREPHVGALSDVRRRAGLHRVLGRGTEPCGSRVS